MNLSSPSEQSTKILLFWLQFVVSLVCQLFYHVVNADSCWKQAFIKFFGASVPFKRLDPKSWRGEYIKRTRLLRRWEKGRGFNIMIDPKIGQITELWAEMNNTPNQGWFLAGGLSQGGYYLPRKASRHVLSTRTKLLLTLARFSFSI